MAHQEMLSLPVRRLFRYLTWTLFGILLLAGSAWWMARPMTPDAFYEPPAGLSSVAGTLLRQEPFERGVPPNAQAWRILYSTTRHA